MVKNPPPCAGDIRDSGSIPGSGRSSGAGRGNPPQYPCLDSYAGDTRESGSIPGSGDRLEQDVATHRSIPAWRIEWAEEPGGPQSTVSHSVGQD